jgi:hypothetical protein
VNFDSGEEEKKEGDYKESKLDRFITPSIKGDSIIVNNPAEIEEADMNEPSSPARTRLISAPVMFTQTQQTTEEDPKNLADEYVPHEVE